MCECKLNVSVIEVNITESEMCLQTTFIYSYGIVRLAGLWSSNPHWQSFLLIAQLGIRHKQHFTLHKTYSVSQKK